MKFEKTTIKASPYLGVFSLVTEKIALIPQGITKKEANYFKDFEVEVIKCSLGESSLIGVLASAVSDKILVSEIVTESEIHKLTSLGLKTQKVLGVTALGNLLRVTEKGGFASKTFSKKQVTEIESFLGIKISQGTIASSDLIGSSCVANPNGFLANPEVTPAEFSQLEKALGVSGVVGTANYGDRFVGNCILTNSKAVLTGKNTTGYELIRIDEAFGE